MDIGSFETPSICSLPLDSEGQSLRLPTVRKKCVGNVIY
jgi:hypothetical protein